MLNIILKKPVAISPMDNPAAKSFTCEEIIIKLDAYDQEYLVVTEEAVDTTLGIRGLVRIKHQSHIDITFPIQEP